MSPFLEKYFEAALQDKLPLPSTDLDRPLSIYAADGPSLLAQWLDQYDGQILKPAGATLPVLFGEAVELVGYDLQTPVVAGGGEVRLVTFWQVKKPLDGVVLFTHILGPDGRPVAQADRLDAPSDFWVDGDIVVQLHQFQVPDSVAPGEYPILVGLYTRTGLQRLPVLIDGTAASDHVRLPPLTVTP